MYVVPQLVVHLLFISTVLLSSKLSKKGNAGEARYSVNDPSYPIWIPGYSVRPGTDPKNMYKYIPKKNDISLEFEKANSREDNEAVSPRTESQSNEK